MSAETLRRAAGLMRERAAWVTAGGDIDVWYEPEEMLGILRRAEPEHSRLIHDAAHIASWHPAVALAVADWLDACALVTEVAPGRHKGNALTVARAYLGEDE